LIRLSAFKTACLLVVCVGLWFFELTLQHHLRHVWGAAVGLVL